MSRGGSFTQLLKAGQWHPSAYRLYKNAGVEETQAIDPILIEASDAVLPGQEESQGEGSPDPKRWGFEKPDITFGMISNLFIA